MILMIRIINNTDYVFLHDDDIEFVKYHHQPSSS